MDNTRFFRLDAETETLVASFLISILRLRPGIQEIRYSGWDLQFAIFDIETETDITKSNDTEFIISLNDEICTVADD